MKHGALFGRKEGEEGGENKGGTQEEGVCSVVCGFQQKNYLCLLAEMVLLLKGPWPPSKNWVFPREKLGAWQAGVYVYSTLPSLLRGLGFGGRSPRKGGVDGDPTLWACWDAKREN